MTAETEKDPAPVPSPPAENDSPPRVRAVKGLLAATLLGLMAYGLASYGEQYGGTVAVVDGARIPKSEFQRLFKQVRQRYGAQFQVDFESASGRQIEADLKQSIVKELVHREMVRLEAEARGLSVPESQVEGELERIRKGFKSPAEFEKLLADQGADEEALRQQIRSGMLESRLQEAITGATAVSVDEARQYYTQHAAMYRQPATVHARHILVKQEPLAMALRKELQGGADFAKLAAEHSEDSGSRSSGGDLGFFPRGKMVKEFENAAFSLPVGAVSQPVKSDFGFHLIKVEATKPARNVSFEEVQSEIIRNLTTERRKAAFAAWMQQRQQRAVITYSRGFEAPAPGEAGHEGHDHAQEGH